MTMPLTRGQRIGRWTLGDYRPDNARKRPVIHSAWECTCDCGTKRWVPTYKLRAGKSQGCKECGPKIGRELALRRHARNHDANPNLQREGVSNLLAAWCNLAKTV